MANTAALAKYRAKLSTLEEKLRKLKAGELVAGEAPGESQENRQAESISRTELFIRQIKEEIAKLEAPAKPSTPQRLR